MLSESQSTLKGPASQWQTDSIKQLELGSGRVYHVDFVVRVSRNIARATTMPESHRRRPNEVDARSLKLHFSPAVKRALGDLEAAVHFSEHFDGDVKAVLHDWAAGKTPSVHEVLVALPLVAEETFRHVRATEDERAEHAWREVCNQMPEKGFTTTQLGRER